VIGHERVLVISSFVVFFSWVSDFNSDKELEYSYSDEELAQILADKTYLVINVKEIVAKSAIRLDNET